GGCLGLAWAATVEIHAASTVQAISLADSSLPVAAGGNSDSSDSVISSDGRFVLFLSSANNLVTNDDNGKFVDVFLRDRTNGVTSAGAGGNGASTSPLISPDGRYVAFVSAAGNLVANDTNNANDIFVRDLQNNTTTLVSVSMDGATSGNGGSDWPTMTPDGRWVAFVSKATNLVAGASNNLGDMYARDLVSGTTIWVGTNVAAIMS